MVSYFVWNVDCYALSECCDAMASFVVWNLGAVDISLRVLWFGWMCQKREGMKAPASAIIFSKAGTSTPSLVWSSP